MTTKADWARWTCETDFDKWDSEQTAWVRARSGLLRPTAADFGRLRVAPAERVHIPAPANGLTTVGLQALTLRLVTAAQVWDQTHVGLGVGTSTTGFATSQTDLVGTKRYNTLDSGYPQQANGQLTFKATYGNGEAEFAWEEYGAIVNSGTATVHVPGASKTANYVLLNRMGGAGLGSKGAGTTWAFTMTITIA